MLRPIVRFSTIWTCSHIIQGTDSATVLKLADQIGGRWHARQNNGGTCDLLLPVVGLGPRWTAKDPHRSSVSDDVPFSCVNLRFKAFISMSESDRSYGVWSTAILRVHVHARSLLKCWASQFGVTANERMIRLDFMLTVPRFRLETTFYMPPLHQLNSLRL